MKTNTLGTTLLVIGVILGMSAWVLHDRGDTPPPESSPKNQNTIVRTQRGISSGTTQVVHSGVADFYMPNLEWKSRDVTLSDGRTVHYVFGEGNPKEVALSPEEVEAYLLCKTPFLDPSYGNIEGQCTEGRGYVTPDFEHKLKALIEHPYWERLITECSHEYKASLNYSSEEFEHYVVEGYGRNLNHLIAIDPVTGRKEPSLANDRTMDFRTLKLRFISVAGPDDMGNYAPCMGQYAPTLITLFQELEGSYVS
mgnify:CR=1 FL=1